MTTEGMDILKAAAAEMTKVLLDQSLPVEKKVALVTELASQMNEQMKIAHNEGLISAEALERIGKAFDTMKASADKVLWAS